MCKKGGLAIVIAVALAMTNVSAFAQSDLERVANDMRDAVQSGIDAVLIHVGGDPGCAHVVSRTFCPDISNCHHARRAIRDGNIWRNLRLSSQRCLCLRAMFELTHGDSGDSILEEIRPRDEWSTRCSSR